MKVINKLLTGTLILILTFGLSSCLKNGQYYTNYAGVAASIDIPLSAPNVVIGWSGNSVIQYIYGGTNQWYYVYPSGFYDSITASSNGGSPYLPIYVNVASPSVLGTAVTATLAIDTAYFNSYNNANGGTYAILPDSDYTVSTWNLTVPAGKRLDSMQVTFNFANINGAQNYVLPITIASSSLPIEQWNHLMLNVFQQ